MDENCRGGDALEGAESEIWCEANAREGKAARTNNTKCHQC